MSDELPKGWASARLVGIVTAKKGKKPAVLRDSPADGFVPYLDIHAIEKNVVRQFAEAKSSRLGTKDDLFVVWDGARSGWIGGGITGAIGSTIMALTAQQVESGYLRHFIASQFQTLNNNTRGTGIPHVDPEVFWNLEVPLAPLAEQRRIVAKLTELLGKVDASQQRLAKIPVLLKRFRQSVLAAACSGRLTADWREAQPTLPAFPDDDDLREHMDNAGDLPDLPDSWVYRRTADVVEPGTVITYGIVLPGPNQTTGVPYIRGQDIDDSGRILVEQLWKTTPAIAAKHARSELCQGDILLCVIRHLRVAIVPAGIDGANLTKAQFD